MEIMDLCPQCNQPLRNGRDSPLEHEYDIEMEAKFKAGVITLEELKKTAKYFYYRQRVCENPLCSNFVGDPENPYKKVILKYNRDGKEVNEETQQLNVDYANPRIVVQNIRIDDV